MGKRYGGQGGNFSCRGGNKFKENKAKERVLLKTSEELKWYAGEIYRAISDGRRRYGDAEIKVLKEAYVLYRIQGFAGRKVAKKYYAALCNVVGEAALTRSLSDIQKHLHERYDTVETKRIKQTKPRAVTVALKQPMAQDVRVATPSRRIDLPVFLSKGLVGFLEYAPVDIILTVAASSRKKVQLSKQQFVHLQYIVAILEVLHCHGEYTPLFRMHKGNLNACKAYFDEHGIDLMLQYGSCGSVDVIAHQLKPWLLEQTACASAERDDGVDRSLASAVSFWNRKKPLPVRKVKPDSVPGVRYTKGPPETKEKLNQLNFVARSGVVASSNRRVEPKQQEVYRPPHIRLLLLRPE